MVDGGSQDSGLKTQTDRKDRKDWKDWKDLKDRKSGELSGSPGPGGNTGGAYAGRHLVGILSFLLLLFMTSSVPQSNRYTTTVARNSPVRDWNFLKKGTIWQQNEVGIPIIILTILPSVPSHRSTITNFAPPHHPHHPPIVPPSSPHHPPHHPPPPQSNPAGRCSALFTTNLQRGSHRLI